jgi:hypothetical protein
MQLDRFSGAFKIDPFATTAVPMNKRADEMIFHCKCFDHFEDFSLYCELWIPSSLVHFTRAVWL